MPDKNDLSAIVPVGLCRRVIAFAYDYLVILAYILVLTMTSLLVFWLRPALRVTIFSGATRADLFAFFFLVLPVILYGAICESSAAQATWGKRRARLRVIDTHGRRVSLWRALLRNGVKYLPWQIAHTSIYQVNAYPQLASAGLWLSLGLALVYILVLALTKTHRAPYDWLAGTQVSHSALGNLK